jgi:membrane associated rhomboid family serine protease
VGVHPLPWREGVFTRMFMHASWLHVLGNMSAASAPNIGASGAIP